MEHKHEISWAQYMVITEKAFKRSNRLIEKLVNSPDSKKRETWISQIIELGCYDEDDIKYLIKFYGKV